MQHGLVHRAREEGRDVGRADGRVHGDGLVARQLVEASGEEWLGLEVAAVLLPDQHDEAAWPALRERFAEVFRRRSRAAWLEVFADDDNCVSPVLPFTEVLDDEHLAARGTYVDLDGVPQPAPAPRFDRTPAELHRPPPVVGQHTAELLAEAGFSPEEVAALRAGGAVA